MMQNKINFNKYLVYIFKLISATVGKNQNQLTKMINYSTKTNNIIGFYFFFPCRQAG